MMVFDLHIHSKYSFDSMMEPHKILKAAKRAGLNGIAITDHNTIRGGLEAQAIADDSLIVICGAEITTDEADIIGLFLHREIYSRQVLEVIYEIKSQGGLVVLAHPFERRTRIKEELLREIDLIEGFNSRASSFGEKSANGRAQKMAATHGLPFTAGSDAHFYFEIGRGRCYADGISTLAEFRAALIGGRVKVEGIESSPYIETLSQLVKLAKTRQIKVLSTIGYSILSSTLSLLRRSVQNGGQASV